jgi:hypothetical protein
MIKNKLIATLSALALIGSNFAIASETSQEATTIQTSFFSSDTKMPSQFLL